MTTLSDYNRRKIDLTTNQNISKPNAPLSPFDVMRSIKTRGEERIRSGFVDPYEYSGVLTNQMLSAARLMQSVELETMFHSGHFKREAFNTLELSNPVNYINNNHVAYQNSRTSML